ncbi:MAG: phosphoribosylanthranilate isomerase [Bacteroidales bacterium]
MKLLSKICGLREAENIELIFTKEIAPDLYGFIFYPPSPRYVSKDLLPSLASRTQPIEGKRVGVFVDADMSEILNVHRQFPLDWIQLHGTESPALCEQLRTYSFRVIKAFSIQDKHSQILTDAYEETCDFFLFDTAGKAPGGNGHRFNWQHLERYQGTTPFILSGGITPQHVSALKELKHSKFHGIDLNSGFEVAAGKKDTDVLTKFLKALS